MDVKGALVEVVIVQLCCSLTALVVRFGGAESGCMVKGGCIGRIGQKVND